MKWTKRILLSLLCCGLALSAVACGKGDGKGINGKPAAMGRYVEKTLGSPEGDSRYQNLFSNEDGSLDYYGIDSETRDLVWFHSADGTAWEKQDTAWYNTIKGEKFSITALDRDTSGALYLLGMSGDGLKLYRVENEMPTVVAIPSWEELDNSNESGFIAGQGGSVSIGEGKSAAMGEEEGAGNDEPDAPISGSFHFGQDGLDTSGAPVTKGMSLMAQKLLILEGGDILVSYWSHPLIRYDGKTGEIKAEYGAGASDFIVNAGKLYLIDQEGATLSSYDLESGTAGETISIANIAGQVNTLASGGDQGIYLCNSKGIHRLASGGSVWETLVESNLSSLGVPALSFSGILPDQKGGFYLAFTKYDGGAKLVYTSFDPNTPSVPDTELTVYSLYDNDTVRQTIGDFQQSHPNVMVNFQVGITDESSATVSDVIRALGTEILAGKGPDVLILDGLPLDSYLEKGVLADLSDLLESLPDGSKPLGNIVSGLNQDGKTRVIPMRFSVPVLSGESGAVDPIQSIADLAKVSAKLPALQINDSDQFLSELVRSSYAAWIGADGNLDTAQVAEFFTSVKKVYDKYQNDLGQNGVIVSIAVDSTAAKPVSINESMMNYMMGQTSLYFSNIDSLSSLGLITGNSPEADGVSAKPFPGQTGNVYIPSVMAGVNAAGKQQDLAKEFLKAMLDPGVQGYNFGDGLPVVQSVLDSSYQDEDLKKAAVSLAAVQDAIKNAAVPVVADRVIEEAVLKEGKAVLAGDKTVNQAVTDLLSAVKIYMAE